LLCSYTLGIVCVFIHPMIGHDARVSLPLEISKPSSGKPGCGGERSGQMSSFESCASHAPIPVLVLLCLASLFSPVSLAAAPEPADLWVWGNNNGGQLGNGTNEDSNVPIQVTGPTNVISIAAGGRQGLALVKPTPAPTPTSTSVTTPTIKPTPESTPTTAPTTTATIAPPTTPVTTPMVAPEPPSGGAGNSWWLWLVSGLVFAVVIAGVVWRMRHKATG
jgi:hypothetical protein